MMDNDFWKQSNWYAIQTKPSREDQASGNIRRLGLPVLLPKIKQEKLEFGRRKAIVKPLFPGYLFAWFCPSPYLHSIRFARGVTRVLCAGETPIPLSEDIISSIRSRLGKDGFVKLGASTLQVGDRVVVSEGPLQGLAGVYDQDLPDQERAVILLRAVEYQARVFIEKRYLRAPAALE